MASLRAAKLCQSKKKALEVDRVLTVTIRHMLLFLFILQLLLGAVLITRPHCAGAIFTKNRKVFQCNEKWHCLLYFGD